MAQNDLAGPYLASRSGLTDDAVNAILSRHGLDTNGNPTAAKPTESAGTPQAPAAAVPQGKGALQTGLDIAKDVATGVTVDQPKAVYGGVHDAIQNTYKALSDFGDWMSDKSGFYGVHVGKDGVHLENKAEYQTDTDPVQAGLAASKGPEPTSVTGGLFKGVYQFLTGLALTRGMVPEAGLGTAAQYGVSALRGAAANFAAFDPHQQRLDNLIEQFPALRNPVSEFLAAKPTDGEAAGRFKNALEGLGFGMLTDGFVKGVRVLRAAQDAQTGVTGLKPGETPPVPGAAENAFRTLGDEKAPEGSPLFQVTKAPSAKPVGEGAPALEGQPQPGLSPQEVAEGTGTKPQTFVNYAKIDAPADVTRAMQEIADAREAPSDGARAGAMSFTDMKLDAAHEDAWKVLQSRQVGEPLPAPQMLAVRGLWVDSTDKLVQLAHTAADAPTPENLFAFKKMQEVQGWIQDHALGAQTSAARSLASFRIPVGTNSSRLQDISERLADIGGGADNVREAAQKVAWLSDQGNLVGANEMMYKSRYARTRDALIEAFRGALLSSPTTQATILASNVSTSLYSMLERAGGTAMSRFLGTEGGVAPGEASALWSGYVGTFRDGLASAGKVLRGGPILSGIGEPHEARPSAISSVALNLDSSSALGRAADFMGAVVGASPRAIMAQHDMSTTMNFGAELNAQAVRQATGEVNAGTITSDAFNERVAALLADPPEHLLEVARTQAKYRAFLDEPGKLTNALINLRKQVPALNAIIPFLKIVSRIQSYAFERTPLAPLMSEWRAKVAAGGATRDLALAQTAMGSMLTLTAADMVMGGTLRGGGLAQAGAEQAQEREGALRDSLKIGTKWYSINRIHPIGKIMLLGADVAETLTSGQTEVHDALDVSKILGGAALAIGRNVLDNSYFQGIAQLFASMHEANIRGGGMSELLSLAGGAVPAGAAAVARAMDPYERAVYSMLDEFKSRIPGLSRTLPPARDLWGNPKPSGYGPVTDLLSPVRMSDEKRSPIDDELTRLGANISMPESKQRFGTRGNEVAIDLSHYPQAYNRLLELSGHEIKGPFGLGLKELLDETVQGKGPLGGVYNIKKDAGKEMMIRELISQYQQEARDKLIGAGQYSGQEPEVPELAHEVHEKAEAQQALKLQP